LGININSGGGGSPVTGTVIAQNVIRDEDVDVAINTPAYVEIHFNDLLGGNIGVANVCAYDKAANCSGVIDASLNYWDARAASREDAPPPTEPLGLQRPGFKTPTLPTTIHRRGP
jgi:hypothetical protein